MPEVRGKKPEEEARWQWVALLESSSTSWVLPTPMDLVLRIALIRPCRALIEVRLHVSNLPHPCWNSVESHESIDKSEKRATRLRSNFFFLAEFNTKIKALRVGNGVRSTGGISVWSGLFWKQVNWCFGKWVPEASHCLVYRREGRKRYRSRFSIEKKKLIPFIPAYLIPT